MSKTITLKDNTRYHVQDIVEMLMTEKIRYSTCPPKCYVMTEQAFNNNSVAINNYNSDLVITIAHHIDDVIKNVKSFLDENITDVTITFKYYSTESKNGTYKLAKLEQEQEQECVVLKINNITEKEWTIINENCSIY